MKSITSSFLSGLLCIVIALTTSSSLSGCVVAPWDMFRTQEGWEPSNYYIDQYLVYDGNPIELTMVLGGYVEACEIGVLVFIDGIIQVYHTEQAEQDAYIHNSKYAANERREVTLFVEPNIGSKGETLYLGTVVIKNPDAVLQADDSPFSEIWISSNFAAEVLYAADPKLPCVVPKDEGRMTGPFRWGSSSGTRYFFDTFQNEYEVYPVSDGQSISVTFSQNVDLDFRFYLFTNMNPQESATGELYTNVFVRNKKSLTFDIDLDLSTYQKGQPITMIGMFVPLVDFSTENGTDLMHSVIIYKLIVE